MESKIVMSAVAWVVVVTAAPALAQGVNTPAQVQGLRPSQPAVWPSSADGPGESAAVKTPAQTPTPAQALSPSQTAPGPSAATPAQTRTLSAQTPAQTRPAGASQTPAQTRSLLEAQTPAQTIETAPSQTPAETPVPILR